ncbi:hypothetical protein MFRU_016g01250 [Monilinia fructicola]|nr:hypothetical protein MFRU_016g01250 [Monilinia fructicola]
MASQSYRPLDGKLAIVTGASRGIGAAIAENLASKGANIVLNHTSSSSSALATELSKSLEGKYNIKTLVVQADVSEKSGADSIISSAKSHFSDSKSGKFQIDILVNNAGIAINAPIKDVTIDDFQRQYKINVLGPLLVLQAALDYLPHDRSGRIVNVSSVSASGGFTGQTVYGGTKGALDAMTRTWARELNNRATVNSINPGPVKTDMWYGTPVEFRKSLKPLIETTPGSEIRPELDDQDLVDDAPNAGGRPAYTHEIGGIVGMLATSDSVWCTGQVVCANGGFILK